MESEVLVSISMRFPAIEGHVLAEHVSDVVKAAIAAGGVGTSVSVQPFDPDEEDD
jgi:hypothetical protein